MESKLDFNSDSLFRIIFEGRENYRLMDNENNIWPAVLAGKVRNTALLWPAIGDWIKGRPQPGGWILIEEVIERKTVLVRKDPGQGTPQILAANVDTLFIVTSANQDWSLNRLDRYVALALSGRVQPVIVINKIELVADPQSLLDATAQRFVNVNVHGMSAHEGWNLESLDSYAQPGKTVAFIGSSGVGKSSLTNALMGQTHAHVQEIRGSDGRGRHTTTHRELHVTPSGALVIDTPGLRQVGLVEDMDLHSAFTDMEELAARCRFTDCRHESEPGCVIQDALARGALDSGRWRNYLKLQKELEYERRKSSKALQSQEKKRWAKIHIANRSRQKSKDIR